VLGGVTAGAGEDHDLTTVDRHVEPPGVVGEQVEGAARGQVEAGVVPVAGHHARLERALPEGEAHVGAPVLERPGAVVVPEHDHGQRPDLPRQASGALQIGERAHHRSVVGHGRDATTSSRVDVKVSVRVSAYNS
jgi:hypothetical protein